MRTVTVILAVVSLLYVYGCAFAQRNDARQDKRMIVGGRCDYDSVYGKCTITSVQQTFVSKAQKEYTGTPGYEGYEVKFTFTLLSQENDQSKLLSFRSLFDQNIEQILLLDNSWYPGRKYLDKYKIKEGAVFDCVAKVITRGTCTPVLYTFPSINTADYFESKTR